MLQSRIKEGFIQETGRRSVLILLERLWTTVIFSAQKKVANDLRKYDVEVYGAIFSTFTTT